MICLHTVDSKATYYISDRDLTSRYEISSEPDYGVYVNRGGIMHVLVVVEDKPKERRMYQHGECQLYGELLSAALSRFSYMERDHLVFGMILRGPLVRFYKANFCKEYLLQLQGNKIPSIEMRPKRYPEIANLPLSLNSPKEREKVVRLLHAIRSQVECINIK